MPLQLKFHGALETVTGSCHFFRIKISGNIYAVDCGKTQGEGEEQLAAPCNLPYDCSPDRLSGIILTHAHGDHLNYLPDWIEAGFKGKIFCTKETAKLAAIAIEDSNRIQKDRGDDYNDDKILSKTLKALEEAKYIQPGSVQILENNVTIESSPTSHLLGCCAYRITATNSSVKKSVLFTADIGPVENGDETQSLHAARVKHSLSSDYIVSESTYGNRPRRQECRSGLSRQKRISDVLSKAFRHGDESVVIIPAFSLQRSLDILFDVFCSLHYQRTEIGIHNSVTPLIIIQSGLSYKYAKEYKHFLVAEQNQFCFFNNNSIFRTLVTKNGDDDISIINNLIPREKKQIIDRRNAQGDKILTEVSWKSQKGPFGRPTVIICGSGMTHEGPIIDLMRDNLKNDKATFVLSGYVPPNSPGYRLRELWDKPAQLRATHGIKLPKSKTSENSISIPGDAVKCGFDSVSEYYSGHADGPSITRYILGDNLERAEDTKGIFLVHGNEEARIELKRLIIDSCTTAGKKAPIIFCPKPRNDWFDCELGKSLHQRKEIGIKQEMETNSTQDLPNTSKFPELIDIETCTLINSTSTKEETIDLLKAGFDFARPQMLGDDLLLKIGRPGRPHSTVLIEVSRIGETLLKLSVQSKIKQAENISEIAEAAFDWRRPLNLLGAPTELYYAGARWCLTDTEINRLISICVPNIYGGKERRQPILILHSKTLNKSELESLELLLTPAVIVAVVEEQSVSHINRALSIADINLFGIQNPIYLPIKAIAGAQSVASDDHAIDIARLSQLVSTDTLILNSREPQLLKRDDIPQISSDEDSITTQGIVKKSEKITDRMQLPYQPFTELAVGQKFTAKVLCVIRKRENGNPVYALLCLDTPKLTGILHSTQMIGHLPINDGDKIDIWIRHINAERREAVFTQLPIELPTDKLIKQIKIQSNFTPSELCILLGNKASTKVPLLFIVIKAAEESLRFQKKYYEQITAETRLDSPSTIDTYNRLVHDLRLVERSTINPPEPTKGRPTYLEIANELSISLDDLIKIAAQMVENPETYHLGMSILPPGFIPTTITPFPLEQTELFKNNFKKSLVNKSSKLNGNNNHNISLHPDCLSISTLAKQWNISEADALKRLSEKDIQLKVQPVITTDDINRLME